MNIRKLFLSFAIITLAAVGAAMFAVMKIQELSVNTQKMYTHPFTVSNSVADIQTAIITMHRNMKDVVLTKDSLEMIEIIESIQVEEGKVYKGFEKIYTNYLGDKKDIDTSYEAFKNWKAIRQEVIALVHQGKVDEAIAITKGKGAKHIENLYKQIEVLKNYAFNKADEFHTKALQESGVKEVIMVFAVTFIFSSMFIAFIVISLLRINRANNQQLRLIDQNILTAKLTVKKEIVEISSALCRVLNVDKKKILNTKNDDFFITHEQYLEFEAKIYSGKEHATEIYIDIDGARHWFSMEIFPEFDKNYALQYFSVFLINITDKKKIEEVSIMDSLTGLNNRNYFEMIFEKEIKRAKRDKKLLSIVMMDIDYFKQYNDTYGHQEGDRVLKAVSNVLLDSTKRSYDYAFRVGGEEFVILSYQKDFNAMQNFVEGLVSSIHDLKIRHENSVTSDFLTISAGALQCGHEHLYNPDELYKTVDKLLYEAKRSGRNQAKTLFVD